MLPLPALFVVKGLTVRGERWWNWGNEKLMEKKQRLLGSRRSGWERAQDLGAGVVGQEADKGQEVGWGLCLGQEQGSRVPLTACLTLLTPHLPLLIIWSRFQNVCCDRPGCCDSLWCAREPGPAAAGLQKKRGSPSLPSHMAGGRPMGCTGRCVPSQMMVPAPTMAGNGLAFLMLPKSLELSDAASMVGKCSAMTSCWHQAQARWGNVCTKRDLMEQFLKVLSFRQNKTMPWLSVKHQLNNRIIIKSYTVHSLKAS